MRTLGEHTCGGCRYWSEMIARAGSGTDNPRGETEALCLSASGPKASKYTVADFTCSSFAKNSHGAVDDPPNYGEESRAAYAADSATTYPNGKPMFAPDGTMLDENGNRSIFDDVDE